MKSKKSIFLLLGLYFLAFMAISLVGKLHISSTSNSPKQEDQEITCVPSHIFVVPSEGGTDYTTNGEWQVYGPQGIVMRISGGASELYRLEKEEQRYHLVGIASFLNPEFPPKDKWLSGLQEGAIMSYQELNIFFDTDPIKYEKELKNPVKESYLKDAIALAKPGGVEAMQQKKEEVIKEDWKKDQKAKSMARPVLTGLFILAVLAIILYFVLRAAYRFFIEEDQDRPTYQFQMQEDGNIRGLHTVARASVRLRILDVAALVLAAVEIGALCIPSVVQTLFSAAFSSFFFGLFSIILIFAFTFSLGKSFSIINEWVKMEEGTEDVQSRFGRIIEVAFVVIVNCSTVPLIFLHDEVNTLPWVCANLIAAIPLFIYERRYAQTKTPLGLLQILHKSFQYLNYVVSIALVIALYIFKFMLDAKVRADILEEANRKKQLEEEGNVFSVAGADGTLITMQRIGDTDRFVGSDGNTYRMTSPSYFDRI